MTHARITFSFIIFFFPSFFFACTHEKHFYNMRIATENSLKFVK